MAVAFAIVSPREITRVGQSAVEGYERTTEDWEDASANSAGYNLLLADLPADEAAIVDSLLDPIDLESADLISGPGDPIEWVHFPETAVLSLITVVSGGGGVEALTTGRDGLSGFSLASG